MQGDTGGPRILHLSRSTASRSLSYISSSSRVRDALSVVFSAITTGTPIHSDALSRFGYALSDSTRAQILLSLRTAPGYPSELADKIGVSRQILSNHLACLRGCGLVIAVPEGRRSRYDLADPRIGRALDDLVGLVLAVDPACCPVASTETCC
jgi:DNA-binding transcriptional ArsR family regulator